MARAKEQTVSVAGRRLRVSNLDKVLYPETGTTKGEVMHYLAEVAGVLLPQASWRPATRKRWVDGVGTAQNPGKVFFRKDLEDSAPDWIPRANITHKDHVNTYPLANEPAVLAWFAQLAALEIHVPQWRFDEHLKPMNPDRMVLDLDPGPGAGLEQCAEVAFLCRELLEGMDLDSYPVTSGSKGIHLYAALDGRHTSDEVSQVAKALAAQLQGEHPGLVVSDMKKSLREGKVLLDWSQNSAAKTTICPYSLRGREHPTVAAPRTWEEIGAPGLKQLDFHDVLERVHELMDPIAPLGRSLGGDRDRLAEYRSKRDAAKTPEPVPAEAPHAAGPGSLSRFVIQEHHARALHWDLRIEHSGVLVSWAVPKGPPLEPAVNRLAVMTEDHPLDYATFEGRIPRGQYGAGTMKIWDTGDCEIEKWREGSEVIAVLHGRPDGGLGGVPRRFALVNTPGMGDEKNWLLQLMKDQPGQRKQAGKEARGTATPPAPAPAAPDAEPAPMLAQAGTREDIDPDEAWAYEMKWDGYRALATVDGAAASLRSRNGHSFEGRFPELQEVAKLAPDGAVLDGEIVALDSSGRPDFGMLQNRNSGNGSGKGGKPAPVHLMLFDALRLPNDKTGEPEDLTALPYATRRERLGAQVRTGKHVHIPEAHDGSLDQALDTSTELGLEGIVAKRLDGRYRPGKRTGDWVKIKHDRHQEVVVIGWRHGKGNRADTIGSLLLAVPADGELHYAGRVGTGFTDRQLREVRARLERLRRKTPPARDVPAADSHDAVWVSPRLVGEVGYGELTGGKRLRHPVWRGWREDKEPAQVRWES
ncbi:ATP-dependent DNA ligase [Paeniglutamicibacter sp. ABSL32-1]|uniref:ATP-dependent DNA ligase n=1 Tax=Paeniglutamicibacter quisquiliarum TaxID=2849498 RepID=UPI001C2D1F9C|nr:ATP-dependent DNA ligase [Paeniglutamicibacter quisquiliarum]MBV1781354.1 ATP-dependent DNA ligase [Paeniglutamicibacter quisquiliarum]